MATELHNAVMNIPAVPPKDANINQVMSYKIGHRDARHAAAELALASHTGEAEPVAWEVRNAEISYHAVFGTEREAKAIADQHDEEGYSQAVVRALYYATPPAATPAAPGEVTDALKQWAWHWFGPDADEEWIAKALANLPPAALHPLFGVDQRGLEVAASFVQLHAPDSPLYDHLRSIAARIRPVALSHPAPVAAPAPASEAVAWEAASERYLADIIDRAPEPLRRLGEWLSLKLDEDDWKTAERYVLGAMESIATPSTGDGK